MWSTITDCFSETRECVGRNSLPRLRCRTGVPCTCVHVSRVEPRIHLPTNDAGERAWRMIIKVSQVGRFVSTLSQFLSSFLSRHEIARAVRSRLAATVTIYSQPSKTPSRAATYDSIDHPLSLSLSLSLSILCHDNARLRRQLCRGSASVSRVRGTINRGNVKRFRILVR